MAKLEYRSGQLIPMSTIDAMIAGGMCSISPDAHKLHIINMTKKKAKEPEKESELVKESKDFWDNNYKEAYK